MALNTAEQRTTVRPGSGVAPVTGVALGALLVIFVSGSPDALSAFLVCVPWLIHFIMSKSRGMSPLRASPSFVVASTYFVFFGSGLISYWINDHTIGLYLVAEVPGSEALSLIARTAAIASSIVVGERIFAKPPEADQSLPQRPAALPLLAQILAIVAAIGAIIQVLQFGGLQGAVNHFISHDRAAGQAVSGTIGATLWGVFALPASIALLLNLLWVEGRRNLGQLLVLGELVFLQGVSIVVFGGRLLLVSTLVAGLFQYTWLHRRGPRVVFLGAAALVLALLSASVLASRAASQKQLVRGNVFDWFGYSIFDVSIAAQAAHSRLEAAFSSMSRAYTAFSTVLPGSGGNGSAIQQSRLDVIVAQSIGTSAQAASSGLPPSLPTSIWLAHGVLVGVVLGLVIGASAAAIQRVLDNRRSYLIGVYIGLWGSFVFNAMKSGDLPLDAGSEISRWIYLAALAAVLSVFLKTERGRQNDRTRTTRRLHRP